VTHLVELEDSGAPEETGKEIEDVCRKIKIEGSRGRVERTVTRHTCIKDGANRMCLVPPRSPFVSLAAIC
jgi:hypothetical protein